MTEREVATDGQALGIANDAKRILRSLKIFQGLDDRELVDLLSQSKKLECKAGNMVIQEGGEGAELFVILAGHAQVLKRREDIQRPIQELGPGECFGEMSLLDKRTRSASVRALQDCKLLQISREQIERIPTVAAKMYRNIAIMLSLRMRARIQL
jgi:CRP/FNR family transcriptional regulator, cyclic AMP receptor protein